MKFVDHVESGGNEPVCKYIRTKNYINHPRIMSNSTILAHIRNFNDVKSSKSRDLFSGFHKFSNAISVKGVNHQKIWVLMVIRAWTI